MADELREGAIGPVPAGPGSDREAGLPIVAAALDALARPRPLWRLLCALVADELGRLRGRAVERAERTGWTASDRIDEDGLGIDSLARLQLVARLTRVFELHRTGVEDHLLVHRTLGDWAEILAEGLRRLPRDASSRLGFETSGTTGPPKRVAHPLETLAAEAAAQAGVLGGVARCNRVVALVPPHHLYGFLWGLLGAEMRGAAILDGWGLAPGSAAGELREGDVLVATPFQWDVLLGTGLALPARVGVSSGAPAPPDLWPRAGAAGAGRIVEVYGSTETAGIGWRDRPEAPFELFEGVARGRGPDRLRLRDGRDVAAPDRLVWHGHRRLVPDGRRDGAVCVGGVTVSPDGVADVLRRCPGVADCAVRLDGQGPGARLKAFVVPGDSAEDATALEAALRAHAAAWLAAPERPQRYSFGAGLPRGALGKPADWE